MPWQTLIKIQNLWNEYEQPKLQDETDIEKRADMLICREDEKAFDDLIKLGQEVDARLLHQDP